MKGEQRITTAEGLMLRFAERTGLTGAAEQQRYLWTDAFAVCNFLGLAEATGNDRYGELAVALVNAVHRLLGRHRDDDPRSGWLNGASEEHPTLGGLRIGKPLPERRSGEPMDERLEWDRDGQYFHYLTKWMHALDQVARATTESRYNRWARELADAAYRGFVHQASGVYRMYWKMSIDLSRPQVSAMGHHDPLDGYITAVQLVQGANGSEEPGLDAAIKAYGSMIEGRDLTTTDPLGLGGLLVDAYRVEQLMHQGAFAGSDLLENLLAAAARGLEGHASSADLNTPAELRLAFRELGLAIGLAAVVDMLEAVGRGEFGGDHASADRLENLRSYLGMREAIESFWLDAGHRRADSWTDHRDINEVMLATSLIPDGCLVLAER